MNHTNSNRLSDISKYRGAIFGLSILGIILFHFFNDVLDWRRQDAVYRVAELYYNLFGSIGVELFVFLSGVGLYFSLSKNPDIFSFYRRRFRRVLIPYLIWGVFYWFVRDILVTREGFVRFILDLSTLSFWLEGKRSVWFIAFIIAVYAVFPLLFRILNCSVKGKQHAGAACLMLCVAWVAFCCLLSAAAPEFYQNTEVALSRVPIFVIGTWYGKRIRNGEDFSLADHILAVAGLIPITVHLMSQYGIFGIDADVHNRFLACLFTIPLVFLLCGMMNLIHSAKFEKALSFVGMYSLELYITHVGIRELLITLDIHTHRFIILAAYLMLSVVFSYAISLINIKLQSS